MQGQQELCSYKEIYGIIELLGLEETLKTISSLTPFHGQAHLPLDLAAPNPIQLGHFQNIPSKPALCQFGAIPCVLSLHPLSPVPLQLSWSPFRYCKGLQGFPRALFRLNPDVQTNLLCPPVSLISALISRSRISHLLSLHMLCDLHLDNCP